MSEIRKRTSITLPADLYELVKKDSGLVLSYFVESALRDYYNLKTKSSNDLIKEKQLINNELEVLNTNKESYINEYELNKSKLESRLKQIDNLMEENVIVNNERELLNKIAEFLIDNKNIRGDEFFNKAGIFIEENNIKKVSIEDLDYLRDNLDVINADNIKNSFDDDIIE